MMALRAQRSSVSSSVCVPFPGLRPGTAGPRLASPQIHHTGRSAGGLPPHANAVESRSISVSHNTELKERGQHYIYSLTIPCFYLILSGFGASFRNGHSWRFVLARRSA